MIQSNEDRIVKSLETIAECQLKQTEMAREAMKKSQILFEANMAMMRESQIKPEIILDKESLKSNDDLVKKELQEPDSNTPTMHDECEDETNEEGDDMPF